jgi:hypothetical protein
LIDGEEISIALAVSVGEAKRAAERHAQAGATATVNLPPLPASQPYVKTWQARTGEALESANAPYYTAEQMHDYARAATHAIMAAERARAAEPPLDWRPPAPTIFKFDPKKPKPEGFAAWTVGQMYKAYEAGRRDALTEHTPSLRAAALALVEAIERHSDGEPRYMWALEAETEAVRVALAEPAPSLRAAFEADAAPLGFDLRRVEHPLTVEPWDDYADAATGHRWAGWLAAQVEQPSQPEPPLDMVLHCPKCSFQHIDAPEWEQNTVAGMHQTWTNPPHRSHKCRACLHIWRPADVPTNGVRATKTKGREDSPL